MSADGDMDGKISYKEYVLKMTEDNSEESSEK